MDKLTWKNLDIIEIKKGLWLFWKEKIIGEKNNDVMINVGTIKKKFNTYKI